MSYRREHRAARASLFDGFDGLEEGGLRVPSSYSHETNEHANERAVDTLQDRVIFLKRLTGDIHDEVESHNRLLDRMGNDMDSSRGVMSGTMERFKMVNDSIVVCTVNCNMDAMHFKGDQHLGHTKFVISIVNPESSVEMLILRSSDIFRLVKV
ncbi:bet1-like SNARE 1-1 isoform X1 [Alnus glutinosa]|uniref:bet1-like SNARE 1-1 isoform X1 n=1 Tax=Alnus glutinosa TaxID=3517 RepID=UPI002D77EBAC|nr:bet1-like SNARE 1-1 isoform X1 [Alnus glutinosa]